jgi:hypothetical protein
MRACLTCGTLDARARVVRGEWRHSRARRNGVGLQLDEQLLVNVQRIAAWA